jgi:CHAD domain-containing protein
MSHRNRRIDPSRRAQTSMDREQLQEPADLGIRRVALSLLRNASVAGRKLRKTATKRGAKSARAEDALHDFRVAVRRLRSWVRAFRRTLKGSISRKQRRQLGEIFHATASARDAAVHLEWMREQRQSLDAPHQSAHAWIRRRLKASRKAGWTAALSAAKRFQRLRPRLVSGLNGHHHAKEREPIPSTGVLIGRQLMKSSDELERSLAAIENDSDDRRVHRARIKAKRLRYVAEQVAPMVPESDALLKSLVQLQDMLGELHDVHVLAADLHPRSTKNGQKSMRPLRSGLRALQQQLRDGRTRAFALFEGTWLHGRADPFFARAREMARHISRLAETGSPERRSAPLHPRRSAAERRRHTRRAL